MWNRDRTSVLVAVAVAACSSEPTPDGGTKVSAYNICKLEVTQRLEAPASAHWAPTSSVFINDHGEGRFTVTSHVDTQNVYGAHLPLNFVCDLRYQGQGKWAIENVQIAKR